MRRIITTILSTIILGSTLSPGVSAMFVEQDVNWWSFDEMLDYYYEIEAQQENTCHGDFDCNMRFEEEHFENDEKYRAMHALPEQQFLITAVNPTAETFKVFLFGQDMMLKRMGISESLSPDSLYVSWLESRTTWGYEGNTMFDKNTAIDGEGWLPVDIEVELSAAGSNLAESPTGRLGYSISAGFFNAQGTIDYLSCLDDPDYFAGAECRLTFSSEHGTKFFPPKADLESGAIPADLDENTVMTEPISDLTEDISDATIFSDDRFGTHSASATAAASAMEQNEKDETLAQETASIPERGLKAPETGVYNKEEEPSFTFPWWLSVLAGVNVAILVWLFWPEFD